MPLRALRAVEWDRLDLLGDPQAADRIMRRYAMFLEVDGWDAAGRPAKESRFRRTLAHGLLLLLVALVAAPVFGALVYLRGDSEAGSTDREPSRLEANPVEVAPAAGERSRSAQTPPTRKRERQPPAPPATPVGLVLTATLGDSWVDARRESVAGPVLFQGTLTSGRTVRFSGRRLWVRLGAASNLAFTLNGKHVDPGLLGTVDVVVTPKGIRPAY